MAAAESRRRPARWHWAAFARTVRAVLWSFFGVRSRADYERDAQQLQPVHVILTGVTCAALLVVTLLALIKFVVLR